jgi:porin
MTNFFIKFGFAAGNGLDEISPFVIAPWAADLEDDVKDINSRNRDYLLTAWYKHTFQINANNSLARTGGLIDGTDYLDKNAFANDECIQFITRPWSMVPTFLSPHMISEARLSGSAPNSTSLPLSWV